jgi:hypothetical protein
MNGFFPSFSSWVREMTRCLELCLIELLYCFCHFLLLFPLSWGSVRVESLSSFLSGERIVVPQLQSTSVSLGWYCSLVVSRIKELGEEQEENRHSLSERQRLQIRLYCVLYCLGVYISHLLHLIVCILVSRFSLSFSCLCFQNLLVLQTPFPSKSTVVLV